MLRVFRFLGVLRTIYERCCEGSVPDTGLGIVFYAVAYQLNNVSGRNKPRISDTGLLEEETARSTVKTVRIEPITTRRHVTERSLVVVGVNKQLRCGVDVVRACGLNLLGLRDYCWRTQAGYAERTEVAYGNSRRPLWASRSLRHTPVAPPVTRWSCLPAVRRTSEAMPAIRPVFSASWLPPGRAR